jgi:hypothetical protein
MLPQFGTDSHSDHGWKPADEASDTDPEKEHD